jgi:hypothetical protein
MVPTVKDLGMMAFLSGSEINRSSDVLCAIGCPDEAEFSRGTDSC